MKRRFLLGHEVQPHQKYVRIFGENQFFEKKKQKFEKTACKIKLDLNSKSIYFGHPYKNEILIW